VLIVDGAGWHRSDDILVPKNITLLPLPPYSPELKRQFKNLSKFSCKKLIKTKTYIKIKAIKKIHSIFHKFMRFYLNFFHAELFF